MPKAMVRLVLCVMTVLIAGALLRDAPRAIYAAPPDGHDVTLADAQRVIAAAIKKADAMNLKMNVAVVDRSEERRVGKECRL